MIVQSRILGQSDNSGNDLLMRVFTDENSEDVGASVYLKLKKESKKRSLGNLYFKSRSFYVVRDKAKHLHRASKSFGFNWTILSDPFLDIQNIYLRVDNVNKYIIPINVIKEYGFFLNFKQSGFEKQKFLSYEFIKNFKVEDNDQEN